MSRYGASIFIDECHATGFFGRTGRGTEVILSHFIFVNQINFIKSQRSFLELLIRRKISPSLIISSLFTWAIFTTVLIQEFFGMTGAVDIINSTLGKVGSNTLLGMLEEREYKL